MKSLFKKILLFWQEITFIIALGIPLVGMILNYSISFQYSGNIVFCCLLFILIGCLVGQFFWKNFNVAITLAVILGLGCLYMEMAVMADLNKPETSLTVSLIGVLFFLGLLVTCVTMLLKYYFRKLERRENQAAVSR